MLIAFGWIATVVMGATLGLLGGGGSILTVPILVYLFSIDPIRATAYSLFVVGFSALYGAIRALRRKEIDLAVAIGFSVPSILGVVLARRWVLPWIPETLHFGTLALSKGDLVLGLFAVLMLAAAWSMFSYSAPQVLASQAQGSSIANPAAAVSANASVSSIQDARVGRFLLIGLEGLVVGVITGLVGAGGGFLIVPALVLLLKLPMKQAVATSLFVIALKSIIGFFSDAGLGDVDWGFLGLFLGLSIVGMTAGIALQSRVSPERLKKIFAYFILIMGAFILWKEFA